MTIRDIRLFKLFIQITKIKNVEMKSLFSQSLIANQLIRFKKINKTIRLSKNIFKLITNMTSTPPAKILKSQINFDSNI